MSSTWAWSINFKPFGSGAFFAEKNNVLESFLQSVTPSSSIFQEYKHRIAWDDGNGLQNVGDQELFDMLPIIYITYMIYVYTSSLEYENKKYGVHCLWLRS